MDEKASTVDLAPNPCIVPSSTVAVHEQEECIPEFLDPLKGTKSDSGHLVFEGDADDDDSFVDIMSGINAVSAAESEGWTLADGLA